MISHTGVPGGLSDASLQQLALQQQAVADESAARRELERTDEALARALQAELDAQDRLGGKAVFTVLHHPTYGYVT